MSTFRFARIGLKKPSKPGKSDRVNTKCAPRDLVVETERSRVAIIDKLEQFRIAQKEGYRALDALCSTADARDALVNGAVDAACYYTTCLFKLVEAFPDFSGAYFYLWEDSTTDKKAAAFDDFRYDLCGIFFNVGVMLMDVSDFLFSYKSPVGYIDSIQKEAYHYLLLASGVLKKYELLATDMTDHPVITSASTLPLEASAPFARFMATVALAQAQEIGAWKAAAEDANKEKDIVAQLCRKTSELYKYACETCPLVIISKNHTYSALSAVSKLKEDVYMALAYTFAGSSRFKSVPGDALWLVAQGDSRIAAVRQAREKAKEKPPFNANDLINYSSDIIRRNSERVNKINSMVIRAKPSTMPVKLPPSQELARAKEISFPSTIPTTLAPPAGGAGAEETADKK